MAVIGRVLEATRLSRASLPSPSGHSAEPFKALGKPNLFWRGGGNMDSMINHTRRTGRSAVTTPTRPAVAGKRPTGRPWSTRSAANEAFKAPIVIGGIEGLAAPHRALRLLAGQGAAASSSTARRPAAVRQCRARHRRDRAPPGARQSIEEITDVRGTAFMRRKDDPNGEGAGSNSTRPGGPPGRIESHDPPTRWWTKPCQAAAKTAPGSREAANTIQLHATSAPASHPRRATTPWSACPRMRAGRSDPVLYAHANRVLHLETNPGNARALVQAPWRTATWINLPPIPLTTAEMDSRSTCPTRAACTCVVRRRKRQPRRRDQDPGLGDDPLQREHHARLLYGGCTFCSITEHEGCIIQSRSEDSDHREIETCGTRSYFTGTIRTLMAPRPTCTGWPQVARDRRPPRRKPSCVFPASAATCRPTTAP